MNYFNPLPEEQNSPQLISQLQEIYKMRAEDRASLARIETEVAARMKARLADSHRSGQIYRAAWRITLGHAAR